MRSELIVLGLSSSSRHDGIGSRHLQSSCKANCLDNGLLSLYGGEVDGGD